MSRHRNAAFNAAAWLVLFTTDTQPPRFGSAGAALLLMWLSRFRRQIASGARRDSAIQVSTTVSGLSDIDSIPWLRSHSARSGWSEGP